LFTIRVVRRHGLARLVARLASDTLFTIFFSQSPFQWKMRFTPANGLHSTHRLFSFICHGIANPTARPSLAGGPVVAAAIAAARLSPLRLLSPPSVQPLHSSLYFGRRRRCPPSGTRYPTFRLRLEVDDHLHVCDGDIEESISDDDVGPIEDDAGVPGMQRRTTVFATTAAARGPCRCRCRCPRPAASWKEGDTLVRLRMACISACIDTGLRRRRTSALS
jgi:hypothetical protein